MILTMLRRILALLVIVSLLGLGVSSAWAATASDVSDTLQTDLMGHTASCLEDGDCDHSCHASAHLTGLPASTAGVVCACSDRFANGREPALTTAAPSPPRKPPRV
jgi:hypothetical protein